MTTTSVHLCQVWRTSTLGSHSMAMSTTLEDASDLLVSWKGGHYGLLHQASMSWRNQFIAHTFYYFTESAMHQTFTQACLYIWDTLSSEQLQNDELSVVYTMCQSRTGDFQCLQNILFHTHPNDKCQHVFDWQIIRSCMNWSTPCWVATCPWLPLSISQQSRPQPTAPSMDQPTEIWSDQMSALWCSLGVD